VAVPEHCEAVATAPARVKTPEERRLLETPATPTIGKTKRVGKKKTNTTTNDGHNTVRSANTKRALQALTSPHGDLAGSPFGLPHHGTPELK
jgi:hypothetical protein